MEHDFDIFSYCLLTLQGRRFIFPTLVENKSNCLLTKHKKYGKEKKERHFLLPAFLCAQIYAKRQILYRKFI